MIIGSKTQSIKSCRKLELHIGMQFADYAALEVCAIPPFRLNRGARRPVTYLQAAQPYASMRPQPKQPSKTMQPPIAATHSRPVQYSQDHAYGHEAPTPPHYSKKQLVRRLEQSIAKRTTIDASPEGLPIGRPRTAFRPCPKRARGVLPTRAPLFPTTDGKLPGLPPR